MTRIGRVGRWVMTAVAAAVMMAVPAAQQADQAEALLQAALTRERVEGKPAEALPMYERVIATTGASPRVVAQARLQAAGIEAQADRPDAARRLLEDVVRAFPDGGPIASEARARLAVLPVQAGLSFTEKAVFEGWGPGDITLDERFVTGASYGKPSLFVHDNVTDVTTTIWSSPENGWLRDALFSPDGRQIVFQWDAYYGSATHSIMVVDADADSTPRPLLSHEAANAAPRGWAPDGRSVLALLRYPDRRQAFAWVPLDGGPERVIREHEPWRQTFSASRALSPDGTMIAYAAVPSQGSTDQYIYVCDANGQNERVVVSQAGRNIDPVWLPDSSGIAFRNTRRQTTSDLMFSRVPLAGQSSPDEPIVLRRAVDSFPGGTGSSLMRITQSGALYYTRQNDLSRQVVIVDRATPRTVADTFAGDNASWSPDGSKVAFLRSSVDGNELVVRDLASSREETYPHVGLQAMAPRWFSDGSKLVVRVSAEGDGRPAGSGSAFYLVDVGSKAFTRLFARQTETRDRSSVALAPDDRTLYMAARPRAGGPWNEIVAVDLETGDERLVFTIPSPGLPGGEPGLAVSPDGSALAIQAFADESENFGRLLAVGTDGTQFRELVPRFTSRLNLDQAHWTPDGQSILFIGADYTGPHPEGGWRLKSIPAFGGAATLDGFDSLALDARSAGLRLDANNVASLDISPDGARVMFAIRPAVTHSFYAVENLVAYVRR